MEQVDDEFDQLLSTDFDSSGLKKNEGSDNNNGNRFGHLKDEFPDKIPREYKKVLREAFNLKQLPLYNETTGQILVDDMILHENYLAPYVLEDGIGKKSTNKAYTLNENRTNDPNAFHRIRCYFGQDNQEFDTYQVETTYYFESGFPNQIKDAIRDAFIAWENASNQKFKFTESSGSGHMIIRLQTLGGSLLGAASFPQDNLHRGFSIGNSIRFSEGHFHPITGSDVLQWGLTQANKKLKNVAMHEIGHALGFAHFDDAIETNRFHISGTAVDINQSQVSIMNRMRDRFRETLYPDDELAIQTLYPYNGNGSLVCNSTDNDVNITSDNFYLPLALADLTFEGSVSTLDLVKLQRYILGYNDHGLTPYAIQKGGALDGIATNSASAADLAALQKYILGQKPWDENLNSNQWLKLADANRDGVLTSIDGGSQYLPVGSAVWGNDNEVSRQNMTTDIQKTACMIDGNIDVLTLYEYNFWRDNF